MRSSSCDAVVASEKGVVVGRLNFTEDGDPIDCSRMGVGGKAIPPNVDKVCLVFLRYQGHTGYEIRKPLLTLAARRKQKRH